METKKPTFQRSYDLTKWSPVTYEEVMDIASDNFKDVKILVDAIGDTPVKISPFSWVRRCDIDE